MKSTFLTANAIDQTIAPVSTSTAYVGGSNLLLVNIDTNTTTKVALPGSPAFVTQVVANGPDDVWALASADPSFQVRVLYHFDGVTWSTVPLPEPRYLPDRAVVRSSTLGAGSGSIAHREPVGSRDGRVPIRRGVRELDNGPVGGR